MKKLLFLLSLSLAMYFNTNAQDSSMHKMHMMKDCVMMKDGKMMMMKDGEMMSMDGEMGKMKMDKMHKDKMKEK